MPCCRCRAPQPGSRRALDPSRRNHGLHTPYASTPRIFHRVFPPLNPSSRASSPQHAGGTATHLWKGVGQPRCGFALPSGTGEEIPTCPELALARASVVLAKMQKTEVTDIVSTALESLLQGEIENTGTPACALSI